MPFGVMTLFGRCWLGFRPRLGRSLYLQPLGIEDGMNILGKQLAKRLCVDHGSWGLDGLLVSIGTHLMMFVVFLTQ